MATKKRLSDLKDNMPLEAYFAASDVLNMARIMIVAINEMDMLETIEPADLIGFTKIALERMSHLERLAYFEEANEESAES